MTEQSQTVPTKVAAHGSLITSSCRPSKPATRSRTGQQNHRGSSLQDREDDSGLTSIAHELSIASKDVARSRDNTQAIYQAQADLEPRSNTDFTGVNNSAKRQGDVQPEEPHRKRLASAAPGGTVTVQQLKTIPISQRGTWEVRPTLYFEDETQKRIPWDMGPLSQTPVGLLFNNLARRLGVPVPMLSLVIIKIDGLRPVSITPNQINFYSVLKSTIEDYGEKILERKGEDQVAVDLALTVLVEVDEKCPPKMILHEF